MAVIIITGTMGAGKSYTAVRDFIIDGLADGRRVVTNLAGVSMEKIADAFGWEKIRGDMVITNGRKIFAEEAWPKVNDNGEILQPGGVINGGETVLIDECALLFERGKREPPSWIHRYLVMHRHLPEPANRGVLAGRPRVSGDVVFIAQEIGHIPESVRKLCSRWVHCRNMSYMSKSMAGRYRTEVHASAPANEKFAGEPMYAQTRPLDKRVFKCYMSHAVEEGITESTRRKGALDSLKRKLAIIAIPLVLIGGVGFMAIEVIKATSGGNLIDTNRLITVAEEGVTNDTPAPPPPPVREIAQRQPAAEPAAAQPPDESRCFGRFAVYRDSRKISITRHYQPTAAGPGC